MYSVNLLYMDYYYLSLSCYYLLSVLSWNKLSKAMVKKGWIYKIMPFSSKEWLPMEELYHRHKDQSLEIRPLY
jgi:hypothetical protein